MKIEREREGKENRERKEGRKGRREEVARGRDWKEGGIRRRERTRWMRYTLQNRKK